MIEGKLKSGFKYVIEEAKLDDFELFEKLCAIDIDQNNIGMIIDVFKELLGEEQYSALKEHMRDKTGRISTEGMMAALRELLGSEEELKNS